MNSQTEVDITDLPFTDLYLCLDPLENGTFVPARVRPDPIRIKRTGNLKVPSAYEGEVHEIRKLLLANGEDSGTLTYKGLRLRFARFEAADGEQWAGVRAVPLDLPDLDDLGLHPDFVKALKGWGTRKGLIVIGGKTGDGKTTTSVAAIKDYLERIGGLAYTCEDPIEYSAQGAISEEGFCLQYEVKSDEDWNTAIKRAMRMRPDYIFVGEIRTPEAAEHLLKAATSGHLVLTTIHAGSVGDTISAILHLAENRLGPVARQIVADRLIAAVHQTLGHNGPKIRCIAPNPNDPNDMSASFIKSGEMKNLEKGVKTYEPIGLMKGKTAD